MYRVEFDPAALEELRRLRASDRARIVDEVDEHLSHDPLVASQRRKALPTLMPDFVHDPPVWELRVGGFRVFYDVSTDERSVRIRAIRFKGRKPTKEIT